MRESEPSEGTGIALEIISNLRGPNTIPSQADAGPTSIWPTVKAVVIQAPSSKPYGAPDVRKTEARDAAVERRYYCAQQHGEYADQRVGGDDRRWSCRYLVASDDRAIQPALQRTMAERLNAAVVEVASSHVAMLSHPQEVASLIAG